MELGVMSLFLQFLSFEELFYQWDQAGVFTVLLPFLLLFAVIFGILTSTKMFSTSRGISGVISFALSLLIVRVPLVSEFFAVAFTGLGLGLAVILIVLILGGLFLGKGMETWFNTFTIGGVVIGLIVVVVSLNQFYWFGSFWWQQNWKIIVWALVLVAIIAPAFAPPKKKEDKTKIELPIQAIRQ